MNISLAHPFRYRCHNLKGLLENCVKLSTYCNRLEQQSTLFPDRYDPNKYKGDGGELFVEALIKLSPMDNRIGIGQYSPVTENDTGVDGTGIGINNFPATVQVKWYGDNRQLLLERDLKQFGFASQNKYGVRLEDTKNMVVITTAKDLHPFTKDEMFLNKMHVVGYNALRKMVDNNHLFWNAFRNLTVT